MFPRPKNTLDEYT